MSEVIFFPMNALGAAVCPIFNGHSAIISANTDRLKDGKYAAGEMAAFKHNIQATAFLNPEGAASGENADYGRTLQDVAQTGRISFGLYYRTDRWLNPSTGIGEQIPDYYETAWTSAGVAAFAGASLGAAKATRFPNHGQQMFDISNGAYGYDSASQQFGASGGSETIEHTAQQLNYFRAIAGLDLSAGSFANGRPEAALLNLPYILGFRDSGYSYAGSGLSSFTGLVRMDLMSRSSTTRTWDAANAGQFASQADSLTYTQGQIGDAIAAGGWFSDFMHWHTLFDIGDTAFFDPYFAALDTAIGSADVWRAGNGEAIEYYLLRESVAKVGSFVDENGAVRLAYRFKDGFAGEVDGIPSALPPALLKTPLSLDIDLTGTPLAGQNIVCDQAHSIRSMGGDRWIINVRPERFKDGYFGALLRAGAGEYFDAARPALSFDGNSVASDKPCRWAIWRKPSGASMADLSLISRIQIEAMSIDVMPDAGFDYFIGAITRDRVTSVMEFAT